MGAWLVLAPHAAAHDHGAKGSAPGISRGSVTRKPGATGVPSGTTSDPQAREPGSDAAAPPVKSTSSATEPDRTAAYIVGFVRYVRWPDEDSLPAWTVCRLGELPAGQVADYAAQTVRGKPLVARHVDVDDGLAGCQVLDLTTADAVAADAILERSRGEPIMSVGSGADFCRRGGLICLQQPNRERKFDVNLSAVKASGLKVSARLLMLGTERPARRALP